MTAAVREAAATWGGREVPVLGPELSVGATAPDFTLTGRDWKPIKLADHRGQTVILSCVPSVDTPVCSVETQRWEQETTGLGDGLVMITASMDLPPALSRFCGAHEVGHLTGSAHRSDQFGTDYGVLMRDQRILMRAVFVIAPDGTVAHAQYVQNTGSEPDYGAVMDEVRAVTVGN